MNRRWVARVWITIIILGLASGVPAQELWDLWDQTAGTAGFSGTNPDGVWSFHHGEDLIPTHHLLFDESTGNCGHADRFCWFENGTDPSVAINASDVSINVSFGSQWPMPASSLSLHPGNPDHPAPRYSVARWTSPAAESVKARFRVEDLDIDCGAAGDGVDWWLMHGAQMIDNGALTDGACSGVIHSPSVSVAVGDTIDLVVGPGVAGNHGCDSTLVEFSILGEGYIFLDGFDSCDTTAWAGVVP